MAKQIEVQSVTDEVAKAIFKIQVAADAMRKSGLKQRAIVVLLHDLTKVNKSDIVYILNGLDKLADTYLTEEAKRGRSN